MRPAESTGAPGRTDGTAHLLSLLRFLGIFHPFNQFGEPLLLIGLELLFGAVIAATAGLVLAAVFEAGGGLGA